MCVCNELDASQSRRRQVADASNLVDVDNKAVTDLRKPKCSRSKSEIRNVMAASRKETKEIGMRASCRRVGPGFAHAMRNALSAVCLAAAEKTRTRPRWPPPTLCQIEAPDRRPFDDLRLRPSSMEGAINNCYDQGASEHWKASLRPLDFGTWELLKSPGFLAGLSSFL